jgi:hypothetical protein
MLDPFLFMNAPFVRVEYTRMIASATSRQLVSTPGRSCSHGPFLTR